MRVLNWNMTSLILVLLFATGCQYGLIASPMIAASLRSSGESTTTSASQAEFNIPPPAMNVSPTSVTGGGNVTLSFGNSLNDDNDWIGLYAVGAADANYMAWTYTGSSSS